ncbi:Uncharacterized protein APZ42_016826 [Daphnia magna]|uniref:Uncharacterized protein n=1 Tax=Daphnia magna TaxID=35525 RepID=A0A165A6Y1_9CRUS|nr:Uncharacterized protein APZ42_016826 [Daphnia magna]
MCIHRRRQRRGVCIERRKKMALVIYTQRTGKSSFLFPNSFGVMEQAKIDGNIRREKEGASGHK